jgi:hypothetical protein
VIQAAAPDGVSGKVNVTAPALDIAGNLKGLSAALLEPAVLGKDLCRLGAASSLTPTGRGGLRPTAAGVIRPESLAAGALLQGQSMAALESSSGSVRSSSAYRCEN